MSDWLADYLDWMADHPELNTQTDDQEADRADHAEP
ncbi:hypothetical protein EES45_23055 [Streptomyces sp. ADI97-07]|nr:hypothetical protein EES45_23055 [Streptomyces sp. ADI97-07]